MSSSFPDRVVASGLPVDQIIVIGSGILDRLGIRKTRDVDLAVSDELFTRLLDDEEWLKQLSPWGEEFVTKGEYDVWRGWITDDSGHPTYDDLLKDSVSIDGIRYMSLDYVYNWKQKKGRDKDLKDLELIDEYRRREA